MYFELLMKRYMVSSMGCNLCIFNSYYDQCGGFMDWCVFLCMSSSYC